jgi:Protein of unknown function (DUF3562)
VHLTASAAKRIEEMPRHLHREFPNVPLAAIERDVEQGVRRLIAGARFDDYVPLLVHKAVRERIRAVN